MLIAELNKNQKGFAAFYVAVLIMAVVLAISLSIFILTYNEQKISQNIIKSSQAYYTSEAGIEDALFRLEKNSQMAGISYSFGVGESTTTVNISDIIGGARTIFSEGNFKERIKKIEVSYEIDAERVSFRYGAQVDEGGLVMYNNGKIIGNIFSNGNILTVIGGLGEVTGDVIVAATSTLYGNNQINNIKIGSDAYTYSCQDSNIAGKLYLSGGSVANCPAVGGTTTSDMIAKKDFPITLGQINGWKNDASSSSVYIGDYTVSSDQTFGPRKIVGSFTINNNKILTMTGTVWVTGTVTMSNNSIIKLDQSAYGSKSGVLISDDKISIENGSQPQGSGLSGSYLMVLSTSNSLLEDSPAIYVKNNAQGAIFYASNGAITLNNNMAVREVTGYKVFIKPNAEVEYEAGLIDALFSSGPGGSWKAVSWREIE